jgi:WD repeat-containing protein 48
MFSGLIDEFIRQDETYRRELNDKIRSSGERAGAPGSITLPSFNYQDGGATTPRANGHSYPMTPGMGIGVATPGHHLPPVAEDGAPLDKNASHLSRNSVDKNGDYFSSTLISQDPVHKPAVTPTPAAEPAATEPKSPTDEKENGKEGLFGKKFRMGMSFGSKKIGRSASSATEKPVVVDEKAEDGSETSENGEKEKEVDDNFGGVVQRIRYDYEKFMAEHIGQPVESGITPSLPNETPVLKPPPMTTVIIQEETKGGSADLYRGTVATVGQDANLIESRAPWWLGDLLLRVCILILLAPVHFTDLFTEPHTTEGSSQGILRSSSLARYLAFYCRTRW